MNKKLIAAGIIGIVVEAFYLASTAVVRGIPDSHVFTEWIFRGLAFLWVVSLALIALSGRKRVRLFWTCAGLTLFIAVSSLVFRLMMSCDFFSNVPQCVNTAMILLCNLISGGCMLAVALANDGAFRRGIILMASACFLSVVSTGLSMCIFFLVNGENSCGMGRMFSMLLSCSTVLLVVISGLDIAGCSFIFRAGREEGLSESVRASSQVPLLVRIVPFVLPVVLLLGSGMVWPIAFGPVGLFFFIADHNPYLWLAFGWLIYATMFVLFVCCRTWRVFWTLLGVLIVLILVNLGGCATMTRI